MARPGRQGGLLVLAAVPPLLALMPVAGLLALAWQGSGELWPHLAAYVLPDALRQTALLLAGTGLLAAILGVATAWLVTGFHFPGRAWLEWALLLPLAMPTYIVAYSYLDVLHPIGPVQAALRAILGLAGIGFAGLPEIRSMPGAILVMASCLYPYVYLAARAAFLMQSADAIEAARGLGAAGSRLFRRVTLPLAMPAVGVGLSLVMLEALADIGASEFLGVRTLTVAVYVTWTTRGSIEGAAQIALATLAVTLALMAWHGAVSRRVDQAGSGERFAFRIRLAGPRGWAACAACIAPATLGFGIPALHLLVNSAIRVHEFGLPHALGQMLWNSVVLAAAATVLTLALGFLVAAAQRRIGGKVTAAFLRVASLGYALPGTVLAAGLLLPMSRFDDAVAAALSWAGAGVPALLSGSSLALVLAYALRFLAVPANLLEAAYGRIHPNVDHAARSLGARDAVLARRIHLPLLSPAAAAAALIVLIECMKELPATLLLRPLNVETLATFIYGEAARGTYEDGAVAALTIVLGGLVPVIVLVRGLKASSDVPAAPPAALLRQA